MERKRGCTRACAAAVDAERSEPPLAATLGRSCRTAYAPPPIAAIARSGQRREARLGSSRGVLGREARERRSCRG